MAAVAEEMALHAPVPSSIGAENHHGPHFTACPRSSKYQPPAGVPPGVGAGAGAGAGAAASAPVAIALAIDLPLTQAVAGSLVRSKRMVGNPKED